MSQSACQALVLAAGKSSRFKTDKTKLSYSLCGQSMILYPLRALQELDIHTTLIVGYQQDVIKGIIDKAHLDVQYVEQKDPRGTGHAIMTSQQVWQKEHIIVMNGDMPLVTSSLLAQLIREHTTSNAVASFVISHNSDSTLTGYGRVIERDGQISIVETRDSGVESVDCCINAGIYIFKQSFLREYLAHLKPSPVTQELYITDLINLAGQAGLKVRTVTAPFDEIRGVNTFRQLWTAEHIKRSEIIGTLMDSGVQFHAPQSTTIELGCTVGAGSRIEAGVELKAASRIGKECTIGAGSMITNSTLADGVHVLPYSVITDSTIESSTQIGPFAHIRGNSTVGTESTVGNFVELCRSSIARKSKAKHLSYIGDAHIGSEVNIGAGTIFCNYSAQKEKHATIIKDHVFIGSNNSLVAPLTIGAHALTAAGSTITEDVPEDALAIGRARQVNKLGYALIKKAQEKEIQP